MLNGFVSTDLYFRSDVLNAHNFSQNRLALQVPNVKPQILRCAPK